MPLHLTPAKTHRGCRGYFADRTLKRPEGRAQPLERGHLCRFTSRPPGTHGHFLAPDCSGRRQAALRFRSFHLVEITVAFSFVDFLKTAAAYGTLALHLQPH